MFTPATTVPAGIPFPTTTCPTATSSVESKVTLVGNQQKNPVHGTTAVAVCVVAKVVLTTGGSTIVIFPPVRFKVASFILKSVWSILVAAAPLLLPSTIISPAVWLNVLPAT